MRFVGWARPGKPLIELVGLTLVLASAVASWRSANIAADAAETARSQVQEGRLVPFRTALYTVQLEQLANFARVSGTYATTIRTTSLDVPINVFDPEPVLTRPDEQMRRAAMVSRPLLDAQGRYQAEIQAMLPVWTPETQRLIAYSFQAADRAANCYLQLGAHTGQMDPGYWSAARPAVAQACAGPTTRDLVTAFSRTVADAIRGMKAEIEETKDSVNQ